MKKRQKTNFVDDVKVAQPIRHSRTSQVDLLNGAGVGEDLGLVQDATLGLISPPFYSPKTSPNLIPVYPVLPTGPIPVTPSNPITPTTPTTGTTSPFTIPTTSAIAPKVEAGDSQQIQLPVSSVTLQGDVTKAYSISTSYISTWSYVSGPQGASPTIQSPNSLQTVVSNLTLPGDYTFKLYAINTDLNGQPQSNTFINSGSDTVVITVLPQQTTQPPLPQSPTPQAPNPQPSNGMPPPADDGTIDGWDCSQLNSYLNVYNQVLSDPTLTQQTRTSYENALLYINNRINTVCTPSTTPHLDVPSEPTSETSAAPLPTIADIDAMNCDQLNGTKTALVINESAYRTDPTTLQNYINTVNYVDLQFTKKCKNTTPTAPTVEIYAPGTTPYSTGVKSSGGAGGGGGGGSSSKPTGQPTGQNYKTWWWIGVVVVVGALILFKPGTKVGVPSK